MCKGAIESDLRIEDAEAVRTEKPQIAGSRNLGDLLLYRQTLLPAFGVAGRKYDSGPHALFDAIAHRLFGQGRGYGQQGDIGHTRCRAKIGIGLQALNGIAIGIDRIDFTLESAFQQVAHRATGNAVGIVRRAQDGHRARTEKMIETGERHMLVHSDKP